VALRRAEATILARVCAHAGKRRYDRKQSGYGGQTKPVFHKKVRTGAIGCAWADLLQLALQIL
jgi:hypothetical protein